MTSLQPSSTRHRASDPDTSREAAEAITPKISNIQKRILAILGSRSSVLRGGWTDYELEELFGDHSSTIRTRRAELVDLGLVQASGTRKIKGRNRIVWKLREFDCAETVF